MNSNDLSSIDNSWWAVLARRQLHRIQVEVIEAMQRTGGAMSVRDLAKVIAGVEPNALARHHMRRLRMLGVVEYAGDHVPRNSIDVPYRLVRELSDGRP